jgi:hypothetical protein
MIMKQAGRSPEMVMAEVRGLVMVPELVIRINKKMVPA